MISLFPLPGVPRPCRDFGDRAGLLTFPDCGTEMRNISRVRLNENKRTRTEKSLGSVADAQAECGAAVALSGEWIVVAAAILRLQCLE